MKKYYAMTFGNDESSGRYYFEIELDDISEFGLIECDGIGVHFEEYEPDVLTQIIAFELEFDEDDDGEWVPANSDSDELTEEQFDTIESIYKKTADSIMATGYAKSRRDIEDIKLSDLKWAIDEKKPGWELSKKVAEILEKAFDDIESAESEDI